MDRRPVVFFRHSGPRRDRRSLHRAQAEFDPSFNVNYQFPDCVSVWDRTRLCLLGGYVRQDLAQRVPIPGISIDGGGQRVSDAIAFSIHRKNNLTTDNKIKTNNHKGHEGTQRFVQLEESPSCSFVSFVVKALLFIPARISPHQSASRQSAASGRSR